MRGVNRLDGNGPEPRIPAQFGVIIELFPFQDIGQFPGHVFGLVLDDVFAHLGEDAIRMEHMRLGDLVDGLVGDFDGALGDLAHHARVDEPGADKQYDDKRQVGQDQIGAQSHGYTKLQSNGN